ncbi:hypothetical protein JQ597_36525 [Bradyrhizobium sp. AUGA SZCCT0177]|uniref:hypothetical protein n=1 Tax=Bradyrhizobium sp. AUGA SZCCT0177 TaxID=2807665 RepID=UPI001BA72E29|nr:hypothetical protein [Bradyrhizobium sp. AUGA SZCCT0177]MBR1287574.1 hypothetical protein [Bradyrhizobium sp. AUGA SZCCT0177]
MQQLPSLQESAKARVATVLGSPACNALLKISLGTVMTPAGLRKHIQGTFDETQREAARNIKNELERDLVPADPNLAHQQRLMLIGPMLLVYPTSDPSEETTMARGAAYLESLDDIPPWALADAIRQWNRGEAGDQHYAFMPPPAVLRGLALSHLVVERMRQLLIAAPSLEAALRDESKSQNADSEPFKPLFVKPK